MRVLSVAEGVVTASDCNILAFRMRSATTPEQVRSLDDIGRPSSINAAADAWAWERLQTLAKTMARINES